MKNETIVDRVVERMKAQPIGDLIREEDLYEIVAQALPKVFFEKRVEVVKGDYGRSDTKKFEPHMVTIMRDLLKDEAKRLADAFVQKNADKLAALWKDVLDAGILQYVKDMQRAKIQGQVRDALRPIFEMMNQERSRMGLPPIYV